MFRFRYIDNSNYTPPGHSVRVQPEADPAHSDEEEGGDVVLQDVMPDLPPQDEVQHQRAELAA